MQKSTNGWRERLAALPPESQARVKAAIKRTLQLRREYPHVQHEVECAASRETAELLQRVAAKKPQGSQSD